jgi:beta-lactamase superfamily II metal-dependent hydrolase
MNDLNLPQNDEIEVSVFSRGIGECVTVHVGNGEWIVIDSFCDDDGRPVALAYLEKIGVSPESIKLISLSHWHDDHIKGAAELVGASVNAGISFPMVLARDEFKAIIQKYGTLGTEKFGSGVREFLKVAKIVQQNPLRVTKAMSKRILYEVNDIRLESLSPSEQDIDAFLEAITEWAAQPPTAKILSKPRRNDTSVALALHVGPELMLFGGDLEVRAKFSGWQAVHEVAWNNRGTASLYKIPHHGSITGHYDGVWADMVCGVPIAVLTPYGRGRKKLPSDDDALRISGLSSLSFSAGDGSLSRAKRQHNSVERTLTDADINIFKEASAMGQARFRKFRGENGWRYDLFGKAYKLAA